ncbi:MAG: hypothetical protein LBR80_11460 [Deltaproteobacteria bacterium]|jgi:hypothetical protein|nr:hypothetical protein [Deltaproteobacteria bacterium]
MIWKTPSGLAYAASVSSSLSRGKNAVLLIPRPLPREPLLRRLAKDLKNAGKREPKVFDLSQAESHDSRDLASVLRTAWNWDDEPRRPDFGARPTLPDLFEILEGDGSLKFLALTGLESLSPEAQTAMAADVSRWAGLSQDAATPVPRGLRLALVAPPSFKEIRTDLFLTRHVFWGLIRQSDLEWAFRRLMASSRAADSVSQAEYLYLKPLCLALCSEDFELMTGIVSARPRSVRDVADVLKDHPLRRKAGSRRMDDSEPAAKAGRHPSLSGGLPPPRPSGLREIEMWSEGVLSAGGFTRVHPALLDEDAIGKAVAAAQREVFLPTVDHVHSILVDAVEMAHGKGIWDFLSRDRTERDNVLTEIGPLAYFITNRIGPMGCLHPHAKKSAQDCAFAWRQLRHAGAHNKIATFENVLAAVERYNEFREHYERMTRQNAASPGPRTGGNGNGRRPER